MGRRKQDRKIERGMRWHGTRIQAYVRVQGVLVTETFEADTPRQTIRDWIADQKRANPAIVRGSLAADVAAYLETIASPRKRQDDAARLAHWLRTPLRDRPRALITSAEIKAQMARWVNEPYDRGKGKAPKRLSAETVNKCLTVLRALYRELNTSDADPNPTIRVQKLHIESTPPRALSYVLIAEILAEIPDCGAAIRGQKRSTVNLTKRRQALMAYTGWPPAQIMRIDPETDIQWTPRVLVRLRPRRKGKGTEERWMPLTPDGEAALRAWVEAKAHGPFSTSSAWKSWTKACKRLRTRGVAVPLGCRPYDTRHAFIADRLRQSGSVAGTQYLAMHSSPAQTMHYAKAVIPEEAERAIAAREVANGVAKKPQAVKRQRHRR
jgi:hypothetical protein